VIDVRHPGSRPTAIPAAALLTLALAAPAMAQITDAGSTERPPGWSLAPGLGVSQFWDDNPTLAAEGDARTADSVTSVRPSLILGFRGKQTILRSDYTGSFDFYNRLPELNTREHRGGLDFTHQITRRLQIFARDQAMISPTTADSLDLVPTVLRRQTTRMNAFSSGFEAALSKRTTLNGAYASQWIDFADGGVTADPGDGFGVGPSDGLAVDALLQGGHSHGGSGELRHRLNARLAIGADYQAQRALVARGNELFDVHSALGVAEVALGPGAAATFGYGHAWLYTGGGLSRSGPAFDLGLDWHGRRVGGTLRYGRAFLPSFGFGGTFQNQELRATLQASPARWVRWTGGVAVSNNEALDPTDPTLRAVSAQTSIGWIVKRRLRLEAFGLHVSQDSGLAGGRVHRTRVGVQATVSDMVRSR
jgi:hypothetical protein